MLSRRAFVSTSLSAAAAPSASARDRPLNFVFILIDDYGWRDTGFNGSRYYETPNIDALARSGMTFTDGYAAAPVCSPTRAALMTGKWPARLHLTAHLQGHASTPTHAKLRAPVTRKELPLSEVTIAEILKRKGYATASIGKWHLGDPGFLPVDQGFDVNFAGTWDGSPKSFFYPEWEGKPAGVHGRPGEYLTDLLTDRACSWLKQQRTNPFFLYLPHYAVHVPIEAKKEITARFSRKPPAGGQNFAEYAAMIYSVDESVGRVIRTLDQMGVAGNTVVFFTADNGGVSSREWRQRQVTSNSPLRLGKGHLYEGGIRVPALVRWPGVTKPGSACHEPVYTCDYYATMAEMAGAPLDAGHRPDGMSIVPGLRGGPLRERSLYWHYPHYSPQLGRPASAMRHGPWKLIEHLETNQAELYHLGRDIGERNGLAAHEPERFESMRAELHAWRKEVKAQMPEPNPDFDPAREPKPPVEPVA